MMLGEFMNSYYEVHAFMIGFIVSFIVFFMIHFTYLWKEKDKRQEIVLTIILIVVLMFIMILIPDWVMENNFYQEIHYGLAGIFLGLLGGFLTPLVIRKLFKS